jgi:hypothetical protein
VLWLRRHRRASSTLSGAGGASGKWSAESHTGPLGLGWGTALRVIFIDEDYAEVTVAVFRTAYDYT